MGRKLINVNPERHIQASKLFPYKNFDHTQRWKTNYGIQTHKHIIKTEGWEEGKNKIFKIPEFDITIGYRFDGKKDNIIYEMKENNYFKKYPDDCIAQANLYMIAEKCTECKITGYSFPKTRYDQPPKKWKFYDIPQWNYDEFVKNIEPRIRSWIRDMISFDCYR